MDAKEQRRKRERERYAEMTDEKKQEKLKKCREAYQHQKKKAELYAQMTDEAQMNDEAQMPDEKKQQKKTVKTPMHNCKNSQKQFKNILNR